MCERARAVETKWRAVEHAPAAGTVTVLWIGGGAHRLLNVATAIGLSRAWLLLCTSNRRRATHACTHPCPPRTMVRFALPRLHDGLEGRPALVRLCRVQADEVLLELGVLCADWLSSVHRLGGYCSQYQAVEEAKSRIVLALRSIRGAD